VLQVQGKAGWFWYIPLHDNIVSVGVVAGYDYLFKNRESKDFEAIYNEELDKCPAVKQRIVDAKRSDIYRAAKEYSYRSKQVAGNGWALVGDALGFLDPLYSSGVLLALKSGELAADAICAALAAGDTSEAKLRGWETDYFRGMERMRQLVLAYYSGLSFGRFVAQHPHRKGDITDLLIGDLFRPELDETLGLIQEAVKAHTATV
jgi:flavin-dependent dehydrogenase